MPPSYNRIPPIEWIPGDIEAMVTVVNDRIDQINQVLSEVAVAESISRSQDGFTAPFSGNINMQRNRVQNGERSKDSRDHVIRLELEEVGIFSSDGRINFQRPVNFTSGATSPGGVGANNLITQVETEDIVNGAVEGAVATSVDGEVVVSEDIEGNDGTTRGTLSMARSDEGKAQFLQLTGTDLRVQDNELLCAIYELREEIRELRRELTT